MGLFDGGGGGGVGGGLGFLAPGGGLYDLSGNHMPGEDNFTGQAYQFDPKAFTDPNGEANRQAIMQWMQQNQAAGGKIPTSFTPSQVTAGQVGSNVNVQPNAALFANPNAAQDQDLIAGGAAGAAGPSAGQNNTAGLMQAYQQQIAGQGPSVAQQQLRQGTDANIQSGMAMAASVPGGVNPALAQRNAMLNASRANQTAAGQGATLRAGEQLGAMSGASGLAGTQQQGELARQSLIQQYVQQGLTLDQASFQANQSLAAQQTQAGLGSAQLNQTGQIASMQGGLQAGIANQNAGLQAGALGLQGNQLGLASMGLGLQGLGLQSQQSQQQTANQMLLEQLRGQQQLGVQGLNAGAAQANAANEANLFGSAMGAAGNAAAMMSDKRNKENVTDGGASVRGMLEAIKAKSFQYKGESQQHVGVMAQDLEDSELGDQFVRDTPQGKMLEPSQGFGAILAAQADLHERLKRLEGRRKSKAA